MRYEIFNGNDVQSGGSDASSVSSFDRACTPDEGPAPSNQPGNPSSNANERRTVVTFHGLVTDSVVAGNISIDGDITFGDSPSPPGAPGIPADPSLPAFGNIQASDIRAGSLSMGHGPQFEGLQIRNRRDEGLLLGDSSGTRGGDPAALTQPDTLFMTTNRVIQFQSSVVRGPITLTVSPSAILSNPKDTLQTKVSMQLRYETQGQDVDARQRVLQAINDFDFAQCNRELTKVMTGPEILNNRSQIEAIWDNALKSHFAFDFGTNRVVLDNANPNDRSSLDHLETEQERDALFGPDSGGIVLIPLKETRIAQVTYPNNFDGSQGVRNDALTQSAHSEMSPCPKGYDGTYCQCAKTGSSWSYRPIMSSLGPVWQSKLSILSLDGAEWRPPVPTSASYNDSNHSLSRNCDLKDLANALESQHRAIKDMVSTGGKEMETDYWGYAVTEGMSTGDVGEIAISKNLLD